MKNQKKDNCVPHAPKTHEATPGLVTNARSGAQLGFPRFPMPEADCEADKGCFTFESHTNGRRK